MMEQQLKRLVPVLEVKREDVVVRCCTRGVSQLERQLVLPFLNADLQPLQ